MKNFRKLSALILSALASFTLLVGCGAAPVEDTTPTESAPVVPVVEKTAPETTPEATPEETPAPQSDTTEEKTESLREFRFTTGLGGANGDFLYDEDGRLSHITLGIYDDFPRITTFILTIQTERLPRALTPRRLPLWKARPMCWRSPT